MKIPWSLYLSWKQLFPTGRGISFFSVLGILGVALGVNVMIVVIAFMKGFQDKFRQDIIASQGHARAIVSFGGTDHWSSDLAKLEQLDYIDAATPYLNGHLLLEHLGSRAVPFSMGIEPSLGDSVIPVSDFLAEGASKIFSDKAGETTPPPTIDDLEDEVVFLSRQVAEKLGARPAAAVLSFRGNGDGETIGNGKVEIIRLDPFVESGTWKIRFIGENAFRISDPSGEEWEEAFEISDEAEDFGEGVPVFQPVSGSVSFASGDTFFFEVFAASTLEVYSPAMLEKAKSDELLPPRQVKVGGVFEVPWQGFHMDAMFGTIRFMQEMNDQQGVAHGYFLKFRPDVASNDDALAEACRNAGVKLGEDWSVIPWFVENAWFFDLLKFEEYLMVLIMVPIGLVAAFAIAIALMTSVIRKTREIGLLVAMGAGRGSVASVFCLQGFVIGLLGALAGWGMALLFIHNRDFLMSFIVRNIAGEDGGQGVAQFYDFYSLNVPFPWQSSESLSTFLVFGAFAVAFSTLAGLLPAWKAVRLNPSEALRSE